MAGSNQDTILALFEQWGRAYFNGRPIEAEQNIKRTTRILQTMLVVEGADNFKKTVSLMATWDYRFLNGTIKALCGIGTVMHEILLTPAQISIVHNGTTAIIEVFKFVEQTRSLVEPWSGELERVRSVLRGTLKRDALKSAEHFQVFIDVRKSMPHYRNNPAYAVRGAFHVKEVLERIQNYVRKHQAYPNGITQTQVDEAVRFVNDQVGKPGANGGKFGVYSLKKISIQGPSPSTTEPPSGGEAASITGSTAQTLQQIRNHDEPAKAPQQDGRRKAHHRMDGASPPPPGVARRLLTFLQKAARRELPDCVVDRAENAHNSL